MNKESHLVAVYGSLRKEHHNHSLLSSNGAKYIGTTTLPPEYNLFSLGSFPGVHQNGDNPLVVEVYEVSEDLLLNQLDFLEGYNPDAMFPEENFYNRVRVDSEFGSVWLYVYNDPINREIITHGDWTKYLNELNQ